MRHFARGSHREVQEVICSARSQDASRLLLALAMTAACIGCASGPSGDPRLLNSARTQYDAGNFVDALPAYRKFLSGAGSRGAPDWQRAKMREGICLTQLERFAEAEKAYAQVDAELLENDTDRREQYVNRGRNSLALARITQPVLLEDTPANIGKIRRLKQETRGYLETARDQYSLVLTRIDAADMDALLGKGECFFHIALLDKSRQAFNMAGETLRECLRREPENKRALFFLGRVAQEDLGNGAMTPDAAKKQTQALFVDSAANHDFHVAYRDTFAYLRKFETPVAIDEALADKPELAKATHQLADYLLKYERHGRHSGDAWGQQLVAQIHDWAETYRNYNVETERLANNVERAERILRGAEGVYLSAYEKAVGLLDEVAEEHRGDPNYVDVRRTAQQSWVEALLDTGEQLVQIGETELAETKFRTALDQTLRPWVRNYAELIGRGQKGLNQVAVFRDWKVVEQRIQSALVAGKLDEAQREFNLAVSQLGDRKATLSRNVEQLRKEVENPAITEYVAFVGKAKQLEDKPSEALAWYLKARDLARQESWPARSVEISRDIAACYYELDDHQHALDAISAVASLGRRPIQSDFVLEGKCLYFKRDYRASAARFDKVTDKTRMNGRELAVAGLAYLKASQFTRAREFLEVAPKTNREVTEGLEECYRELWSELRRDRDASPQEVIDVLESLVSIDPDDYDSQRQLGLLYYERGEQDPEAYRLAYQHLVASQEGGAGLGSAKEKDTYHRLVAFFSDYVPLAKGNRWTYRTDTGATRDVSVVDRLQEGRFRVTTAIGSASRTETWDDADSVLKRFDDDLEVPLELPVRLRTPTDRPRWEFRVRATRYTAEVVGIGEQCAIGPEIYENCLRVQVTSSDGGPARDYVFAPNIGEVRMAVGDRMKYELVSRQVKTESPADGAAVRDVSS